MTNHGNNDVKTLLDDIEKRAKTSLGPSGYSPNDIEAFVSRAEALLSHDGFWAAVDAGEDIERPDVAQMIAIVRAQAAELASVKLAEGLNKVAFDALRERLARAEFAERALLDLRRVMASSLEPSNELGAKMLVDEVASMRERLAKLEAALCCDSLADVRERIERP